MKIHTKLHNDHNNNIKTLSRKVEVHIKYWLIPVTDLTISFKAKEKQEEMALEMKILEKLLEDTRNEAKEENQRKRELREENLRFMQYCKTNRQQQAEREKEVERLVNEEVEKQWGRKMEQYRLEREARKRLMENVLKTREQQIEERSKL